MENYSEARNAVLLGIEERNRSAKEMQRKGRLLYIVSFVNHAEDCLNATRRTLHLLEAIKRERVSPPIPKNHRKLIAALEGKIKPVMLSVDDDEKGISICNQKLEFIDLERIIRALHGVGKYLIEEYNKIV